MTKPIPGIKIPFFKTSLYPTVEGTRCLELRIPDDDAFVAQVGGMIRQLARSFNWEGSQEEKYAKADMWRAAYDETDWEGCMECADVADCIENDEATQAAIAAAIRTSLAIQTALAEAFNPGASGGRAPDSFAAKNGYVSNPDCNLDLGWGNIRSGLIDRSFQRVIDVLEQIEAVTNNQEMLASLLDSIPVIGAIFDVVPATEWVRFFDNVREWMKEEFVAADTITLRDEIACDLFCLWQNSDCNLSIDQIRRYYWNKASDLVPSWSTAFEDMVTLLTALVDADTTIVGNFIVYALVGTQYGFQSFINDWFGVRLDCIFGDLAVGEPSDDWMSLCEDCTPTFEASAVYLLDHCGDGAAQTIDFTPGVPFELEAVQFAATSSYYLAVLLPPGDWQVQLDTFTGTVTPPADLNQDAYTWEGTDSAMHDVAWNTPATPEDFGTRDTRPGSFAPFCATQNWNLILWNEAPFSASFIAVQL